MKKAIAVAGLLSLAACGGAGEAEQNGVGNGERSGSTAAVGATDVQLQPGEWETTVEMGKIEGIPAEAAKLMGSGQKIVQRSCITPDQVRETNPKLFTGKENCRQNDFSVSGGRIRGALTCTEQGATVSMEIEGEYSPTAYDVTQKIRTAAAEGGMTMESRVSARRIGDCPAAAAAAEEG